MSTPKSNTPSQAEFTSLEEYMNELLSDQQEVVQVVRKELAMNNCSAIIKPAVIEEGGTSKISILIATSENKVMADVGKLLHDLTLELNIKGSRAEAEPSPIIRHQYDYVLFGVPNFRANQTLKYLLSKLVDLYT